MEIVFANSRIQMLSAMQRHPYFGIGADNDNYYFYWTNNRAARDFREPILIRGKKYLEGAFSRFTPLAEYEKVVVILPINLLNNNKQDKTLKGYLHDFAYSIICFDDKNETSNLHYLPFDEWYEKYVKVINHPDSDEFKNEIFEQVGT